MQLFISYYNNKSVSAQANVSIYQSLDSYGLHFKQTPYIGPSVQQYVDNIGISDSTFGWIYFQNRNHLVSYAYQPNDFNWENRSTCLIPVDVAQLPLSTVLDGRVLS